MPIKSTNERNVPMCDCKAEPKDSYAEKAMASRAPYQTGNIGVGIEGTNSAISEKSSYQIQEIQQRGTEFRNFLARITQYAPVTPSELENAKAKIDEAVMWATKALKGF